MNKFVWIAGATLSGAILFGAGLLVGRQFPAHRYEHLGNGPYLYDSATGRVCAAFPDDVYDASGKTPASANPSPASANPYLKFTGSSGGDTVPLCNSK